MGTVILFTIIVIVLLFWSLRERMRTGFCRAGKELDTGVRESPFSRALGNLIGVAGGIYLSLVLLLTFLEIQIPSRIQLGKLELEPLATVAIAIAIFQPLFLRLIEVLRRRFLV